MRPSKVISGGQTGGDQAGLFAARSLAIPTGGWAPKGWRTDIGPAPWLAGFGLREASDADYRVRTMLNVEAADVTLIFGDISSRGCSFTRQHADRVRKRWVHIPFDAKPDWHPPDEPYILNVAGNRERSSPGITAFVLAYLTHLFWPRVYTSETAPVGAVPVMRPSPWGNPFSDNPRSRAPYLVRSRLEAIASYESWIQADQQAGLLSRARAELKGRDLVCACGPMACHASVLSRLVNGVLPEWGSGPMFLAR